MKSVRVLVLLVCAVAPASLWAQQWSPPTAMKKLPNGLSRGGLRRPLGADDWRVHSYGIGFRLEPEGRTGFAHLFEHMMFEGTPMRPKGVFDRVIEGGGGYNNGDTRYDFTEYVETAPVSALDPVLWLEADRMKTLDFSHEESGEPAESGGRGSSGKRDESALWSVLRHRPSRQGLSIPTPTRTTSTATSETWTRRKSAT